MRDPKAIANAVNTPELGIQKQVITPAQRVLLLDVSELYRPESKKIDEFRVYNADIIAENRIMARVYETYLQMHTYQTLDFVKGQHEKWLKFDHAEFGILDALNLLNNFVDESDPDVDIPNIVHAFQTAERIRERHPEEDWFHLVGLIHDLGKIMALYGEPQWAVVGDTFPVGCAPGKSVVFADTTYKQNPDLLDPVISTDLGIYAQNCGFDSIMMSWGHDEYMYRVLKNHPECQLPEEALCMIRYHSFYPWHSGGDYWHLACEKDREMYYWIREFNKFDLYSKSDSLPDIEALKPYYQSLIDKYVPGLVKF